MAAGRLAPLMLTLSVSGCLPLPNYAFVSPAVQGKVHRGGIPLSNVLVYLDHPVDERCSPDRSHATRSNDAGEFRFEPRKEFQLFVPMDPVHNWQVCIVENDRPYQGWHQHGIGRLAGIGRPAPEVVLDCDLTAAPRAEQIGKTLGKTMGLCSAMR